MKEYAAKFYKSKQWQRCRAAYLAHVGGLCERCKEKHNGVINAAVIVHHKIWLSPENINDPNVTMNFRNLEAVCRQCHAEEHGNDKRYEVDDLGRVTIL